MSAIPIRNVYYLLCYALGEWEAGAEADLEALEGMEEAHDLLGHLLAHGVFRLVRRGVDQGYREFREEIAGVRGKLDLGTTLKGGLLTRGRTVCLVEAFTADVVHNQILLASLHRLATVSRLDPRVRAEVNLAADRLAGVSWVPLRAGLFRRVQLDRNQRHYRFLLALCQLVLESSLPTESAGGTRFLDFRRNRKRMWRLFERFVVNFLAREQAAFKISGQAGVGWFGAEEHSPGALRHLPSMYPDVVAESSERRIVLDTKFYGKPLSARYGRPRLPSSNLYQMVAYLTNRQAARPDGARHEGILLYASTGEDIRIDLSLQGFRLQARSVDLSRPWPEIRRELLGVLG